MKSPVSRHTTPPRLALEQERSSFVPHARSVPVRPDHARRHTSIRPSGLALWVLLALPLLHPAPSLLAAAEVLLPDGTGSANNTGPRIQFETTAYDFGKLRAGEPVKHTFLFTNLGDATLVLSNVQPSCGCTTAGEWSRQVEPGQTGTIPLQFNSANYSGPVTKTVTVTSNDRRQPSLGLQIKGTLWKPIEVIPQFAVLNLPVEASGQATTVVHILNNLDEPITLAEPESNNHAFAARVSTLKPGREFQLSITATAPIEPANAQAQIRLQTSATNMPIITVTAWANVQRPPAPNPPLSIRRPLAQPPATGPVSPAQTATLTAQTRQPAVAAPPLPPSVAAQTQ